MRVPVLRRLLIALFLGSAGPIGAAAEETATAATGREISEMAAYNGNLARTYLTATDIFASSDEMQVLIDSYVDGSIGEAEYRDAMNALTSQTYARIGQLDDKLAALPDLPDVKQPATQKMAQAVRAFRTYLQGTPEELRQILRLYERASAAVLAGDDAGYAQITREQLAQLANVVDGETALLTAQLEFLDRKSFILPLQYCIIHHNDSIAKLLRSWADADEIDLTAAIGIMEVHLTKADESRREGELKLTAVKAKYGMQQIVKPSAAEETEAMYGIFENMRQAYEVEESLVAQTRKYGQAISAATLATDAASFEIFWEETSALVDRRIALGLERVQLAQQLGASIR